MAYIKMNFSGVKAANAGLFGLNRQLNQLEQDLAQLERGLTPEVKSRYDIENTLRKLRRELERTVGDGEKMYRVAEESVARYRDTEAALCGGAGMLGIL